MGAVQTPFEGWICNLGHGIYPDVPYTHVEAFVEAVHSFTPDARMVTIGTRSSSLALVQVSHPAGGFCLKRGGGKDELV